MKRILLTSFFAAGLIFSGCSDVQREPGRIYMPDMAYSRAYETYADHSFLAEEKINYTNMPVAGTIARGEEMPFPIAKDVTGDTANYFASRQVANPVPALDSLKMANAARLYLINCGICHGANLDGNGPLHKSGVYAAAPANFVDPGYQGGKVFNMPDGQMFYSITYGKNQMGSYASQLSRTQRWEIIHYIKSKQAAKSSGTTTAAADSTATAKK